MKRYRTGWSMYIECVEVDRETEKTVFFTTERGRKDSARKRSEYSNWHDSWEDAKQFLILKSKGRLRGAESNLTHAREDLAKLEAMVE